MRHLLPIACVLLGTLVPALAEGLPAAPPAYGAADFTPSPGRPIGWRGDGHDVYPGANPVTEWDEATGKNILWQTRLPLYSDAPPIVVGKRVIALADPDLIVCLDADTGAILWQRETFLEIFPHLKALPVEQQQDLRTKFVTTAEACYHIYLGGKGSIAERWAEFWREKADRLPNNQGLKDLMAWLAEKHPAITTCYNKGETNVREFTTDADLKANKVCLLWDKEDFNWYSCTFNPPASDGKYIYARMLQNTIVCYDLDGSLQWTCQPAKARVEKDGRVCSVVSTNHIVLYGDLLYVPAGALYVIDTKTGKVRKIIDKGPDGTKTEFNTGEVLNRFTLDGEDYFLTVRPGKAKGQNLIIRAKDAEVVGGVTIPEPAPRAAAGFVSDGTTFYCGQDSYSTKANNGASAFRLVRAADGTFSAEQLWHTKFKAGWRGTLMYEGNVFVSATNHMITVTKADTGEVVTTIPAIKGEKSDNTNHPAAAGGKVYVPNWSGITRVLDAKTGALLASNRTEPTIGTTPTFSGDRIYIRGFCHLYCIGAKAEEAK